MADNKGVTPGTGATFATDEIGGVDYPRVKIGWGPDGTFNDTDTASGKALPVIISAAGANATVSSSGSDSRANSTTGLNTYSSSQIWDGTNWIRERGDTTNGTDVDVTRLPGQEYETVAASQTAQTLGATGATGDLINTIIITPGNLNPGAVTLLDNVTSIPIFGGGTDSVSTKHPFQISLGMRSVSGAWKITTGADVTVIAIGDFT